MLGFDIYSANPCLLHPIRCLVKQLHADTSDHSEVIELPMVHVLPSEAQNNNTLPVKAQNNKTMPIEARNNNTMPIEAQNNKTMRRFNI